MGQNHHYILIMAGGSGTRLYPASREQTPKHLTKIIGKATLLQQTYNRAAKVVPLENIYVSTNEKYIGQMISQVPSLKRDQIIAEPEKRNTAPAFAVGTMLIAHKDPQAVVAAISCDHRIVKEKNFVATLNIGFKAIYDMPNAILTVTIEPISPHTGYEYVEKDKIVWKKGNTKVFKVRRFIERPAKREVAQKFVDAGYFWNASYYVFTPKNFLSLIEEFLPEVAKGVTKIESAIGTKNYSKVLREEFLKFPDAQVDKAIMVHAPNLIMLPADWGWCDIGSWDVVTDLIEEKEKDENGNFSEGEYIAIDSHNSAILNKSGKKLIATIGINNIVVVETDEAILIMEKGRGQEVKKIVEEIKKRKLEHLL